MGEVTFDSVMCGILLGDGTLERRGNARLKIERKEDHAEYNAWLQDVLRPWLNFSPVWSGKYNDQRTGNTYSKCMLKSRVDARLTKLHETWYKEKKIVPIDYVEENFTALSLLIWYLDDGTLIKGTGKRIVIATNCFEKADVQFLSELLERKFGVHAHVTAWGSGYVLRMFEKESRKLLSIVNEVIGDEIACMSYKLNF